MKVTEKDKKALKKVLDAILSEEDKLCLDNDLLCSCEWLLEALRGKVNNCKKRLISPFKSPLLKLSDEEIVREVVAQPGYKNRKKREEESKVKKEA